MTRHTTALAAALLVATSASAFAAAPNTTAAPQAQQLTMNETTKAQAALPSDTQHMSARRVEEIQAALQRQGENIATDGIWGPKTTAALRDFQKKDGLKPTGHYDQATAQKLTIPHWS